MKNRTISKIIICAGVVFSIFSCSQPAAQKPDLQNGDLLFMVFKPSDFSQAVEDITDGAANTSFSHVGILAMNDSDTTVIEAVFPGVREIPLSEYLGNADTIAGKPVVAVARVNEQYRDLCDAAVERARGYIGRTYDFAFSPVNDSIYCSELVWLSYLNNEGKPIFSTVPMSFRNKHTGQIDSAWVAHFAQYGVPIPEGVEGTNPSQMSLDTVIRIVYKYY